MSKVLKIGLIKLSLPKGFKHRFILKTFDNIYDMRLKALTSKPNLGLEGFVKTDFIYAPKSDLGELPRTF